MGVAGYDYFLALAQRAQWHEDDVELDGDLWDGALLGQVAGFCLAEAAVADELDALIAAAEPAARAGLEAQQRDERRHARFFARYAREVVGADDLRAYADPTWRELFEVTLPRVAREQSLADAVGLYHMVLEGVVLTQALHALLDAPLPGLRAGARLILRDERWHVGLGARMLKDLGAREPAILAHAQRAGGDLAGLRRRLAVVR